MEQSELNTTQSNAEETHKQNSTLVEQIEGTPFFLREHNGKWIMTFGRHQITEPFTERKNFLEILEAEKWSILLSVIVIAIRTELEISEEEKMKMVSKMKPVITPDGGRYEME